MYSDYLSINTIFQSSINLEYDLGNEGKIKQYIHTGEGCSILRQYIATMIPEFRKAGDNRATVLLGPYGKGKSFLLLILLYLISSDSNSSCYKKLVVKIAEVDSELGDMIVQLNLRKIKLLPILVNSNYSDLNKAFRIGLSDSLARNNLGSSVVSSSYTVAADILKKWLEDDFLDESQIQEICGKQNCLKQLLNDLEREEITALNKFSKIYENVTGGLAFDPLVREDIPNSLKNLADTLSSHKYSGVFIVFDEFSKFLESGVSNLMEQLSILQNVFEISSRSGDNNQIHICCVTHKEFI